MASFKAFDGKVEVNAETVLSVVDGMEKFKADGLKFLQDFGIVDPAPGKWFPQQAWLDAFKKIAEKIGPNMLFQIGMKIPENAKFPPQINSVETALGAVDMAYHMNHRNGEIGHYNFEKTGEREGTMTCPNPYPCEFDKGLITSMAKKFAPAGKIVVVNHDDTAECRKKGGESCTYKVRW
jgi:hypothetical protein